MIVPVLHCGRCARTLRRVIPIDGRTASAEVPCKCGRRYRIRRDVLAAAVTAASTAGRKMVVVGYGGFSRQWGMDIDA